MKPLVLWSARVLSAVVGLFLSRYALSYGAAVLDSRALGLLPIPAVALTWAILSLGFALAGHRAEMRRHLGDALIGGLAVGSVALACGFIGSLIVARGNQGPMLGIFVTGPLGFVLGAIGGGVGSLRSRSAPKSDHGKANMISRAVRSVVGILVGWLVSSFIGGMVEFSMVSAFGGGEATTYLALRQRPVVGAAVLACHAGLGLLGGYAAAHIAGYAPVAHGAVLAFVQVLPAFWVIASVS